MTDSLPPKSTAGTARKVVLAFFAHPDDAEILCAGTLIRLHEECGYEVHIATATAGDCGSADKSRWEISAIRVAEATRAAKILSAAYHCLDEKDGYVLHCERAISKAVTLFRQLAPTLVFTHPRFDYMIDHEQVHLLARSASFIAVCPNAGCFPVAAGAQIPALYYCDPLQGIDPYTGKKVQPTTVVDVTRVHAKKIQALECHASQRDWLRAHHGVDEYLEAVRRYDAERGNLHGKKYSEAFVQHRGHAYPVEDILVSLLGATPM